MTLLDTIGEELHDSIWRIRDYIEDLPIPEDSRRELYDAIRESKIVISPVNLNQQQIAMINTLSKEARDAYSRAINYSRTLPATNDCDEYSAQEARDLWQEIKSPNE